MEKSKTIMATLIGPMLSLQARGGLAKTLTYRRIRGRDTVGRWLKPPNPKTAAQFSIRQYSIWLQRQWSTIPADRQASWQTLANAARISPYHAYLSQNMNRWQQLRSPTMVADAPGVLPLSGTVGLSAYTIPGGVHFLYFFLSTNFWNVVLFGIPAAPAGPTRNMFMSFMLQHAAPVVMYQNIVPVPPGAWYFYGYGFNEDGLQSPTQGPYYLLVT